VKYTTPTGTPVGDFLYSTYDKYRVNFIAEVTRKGKRMCVECQTDICGFFDILVRAYFAGVALQLNHGADELGAPRKRRPKYHVLNVSDKVRSEETKTAFAEMVARAPGIGLAPGAFIGMLAERSGFKKQVHEWAREKIPHGFAREVILAAAEDILRERGAKPEMTLKIAA
jgi:hypothetical protein